MSYHSINQLFGPGPATFLGISHETSCLGGDAQRLSLSEGACPVLIYICAIRRLLRRPPWRITGGQPSAWQRRRGKPVADSSCRLLPARMTRCGAQGVLDQVCPPLPRRGDFSPDHSSPGRRWKEDCVSKIALTEAEGVTPFH